jgi:hypothetical protein
MKGRFIPAGVLGVVWFLPAGGRATDTAAVVAALPDEAAECRYLLSLCQLAAVAFSKVRAVTTKLAHAQRLPPESHTPATLEALSKLQAQETVVRNEFNLRLAETLEAAAAMRAKHEQPPTCFQQCSHVLGSDFKAWK